VDHLEDQVEDHPEEEPLHPYPLAAVAVEAEAAAAEVEAAGLPPVVPPGAPGGKLGGNPPNKFNGDRSLADEFMNAFNLYRLTNIDTEQMLNPMKRATLLLGFIKGPNVKDWVKCWTTWIITQYDTGLATTDERYWNEIRNAFQASFQDTASRERAEDKLHHLAFIPGDVDTFISVRVIGSGGHIRAER
jgi:hypothetical protein